MENEWVMTLDFSKDRSNEHISVMFLIPEAPVLVPGVYCHFITASLLSICFASLCTTPPPPPPPSEPFMFNYFRF